MESVLGKKISTNYSLETNLLAQSAPEERIISYEDNSQIQEIICNLELEDFLLVEHKTNTKKLVFKKLFEEPETVILED
jgi:hypothetical protein